MDDFQLFNGLLEIAGSELIVGIEWSAVILTDFFYWFLGFLFFCVILQNAQDAYDVSCFIIKQLAFRAIYLQLF